MPPIQLQIVNGYVVATGGGINSTLSMPLRTEDAGLSASQLEISNYFSNADLIGAGANLTSNNLGGSGLTGDVEDYTLHVCTDDADVQARQRAAISSQMGTDPNDDSQRARHEMARVMLESLPESERADVLRELLNAPDIIAARLIVLRALHGIHELIGHTGCSCHEDIQALEAQQQVAQNQQQNAVQTVRQLQRDGALDEQSQQVAQQYIDNHPDSSTSAQLQSALSGGSDSQSGGGSGDSAAAGDSGNSGAGSTNDGVPVAFNGSDATHSDNGSSAGVQTVGYVVENEDGSVNVIGVQSSTTDASDDHVVVPQGSGSNGSNIVIASYNNGGLPTDPADISVAGANNVYAITVDPISQSAFLVSADGTHAAIPNDASNPLVQGGLQLVATDHGVAINGTDHDDDTDGVVLTAFNSADSDHSHAVGFPFAGIGTSPVQGDSDSPFGTGNGFSFAGFGRSRSTSGLGSFGGFFGSPNEFVAGNSVTLAQFNPAFLGVAAGVAGAGQTIRTVDGQVMFVPHSGRSAQGHSVVASISGRGDSGHGLTRDGGGGSGASDEGDDDQPDDQPALFQFDDDLQDGASVIA